MSFILSGNFMRNPQFVFSLTDPDPYDAKTRCPVVLSLAQKVTQRKQEHAIGFRVYKVDRSDIRVFKKCFKISPSTLYF